MKNLYGAILFLLFHHLCLSQAGSVDPTFGTGGFVRTNILGYKTAETCLEIFPQQDGSVFLVIQISNAAFVVHRFQNGALDYGYGNNGYSSPIQMNANAAAIQTDGKILVGGWSSASGSTNFSLARLTANGKLDSSFSADGVAYTDFFPQFAQIQAIAVQADGRIVAGGYCVNSSSYSAFAIARYNIDGSLDNSFSDDGKQTADFGGYLSRISSLAIQSDGKIVASGFTDIISPSAIAVVRLQPDGTFDNGFGNAGKATVYDGIGPMACTAMALQKDGKIVCTGYGSAPNHFHPDVVVTRLLTNGNRDSSFAGTGVKFADMGSGTDNSSADIVIQNDGRIIVGGNNRMNDNNFPMYALMRFLPNGDIDNSYSEDGVQLTRVGDLIDKILTIALQDDGKLIAAGWSDLNGKKFYSVARYNTNGDLDASFDGDGLLIDGILVGQTNFFASVVQPDGKIISVGSAQMESGTDFAVVRYNSDGSLDDNFSNHGTLTVDFVGSDDQATSVALQADGKIVVGGTAFNWINRDFAVLRLNSDGTIDSSFSGAGKLLIDFNNRNDKATSIAIQPDGKIVQAGFSSIGDYYSPNDVDFALCRINPNGTIDNHFAERGRLLTNFGYAEYAMALALQPDGKIILAGSSRTDFTSVFGSNFAIARYSTDGILDSTFHGTGKVSTDIFAGGDYANGIALQPDGKILVVGTTRIYPYGGDDDIVVARYLNNGNLDSSFSADGLFRFNFGSTTEQGKAIALQPDGKIILGIGVDIIDYQFALARLNPDGSFDNSFSSDGKVMVDLGHRFDYLENISLDHDRLYIVGNSDYAGSNGEVAAILINGTSSLTCPTNRITNTDPWLCSAVINNIDPNISPSTAAFAYTLVGATNSSGNGSASGLKFQTGNTAVTYRMLNDQTQTCQFTVSVIDKELPRAEYPFLQNICYNSAHSYKLPALQIMDNCGLSGVDFKISGATNREGTGTDPSGQFNIGTNAIDWIVTDNSGNSIKLYTLVKIDGPLTVTIPDVSVIISPITEVNTVYIGYNPAEYITLHSVANVSTGIYYATEWSDGSKSNWNTVHPSATTTYSVTITDLAGCKATATKTVKVVDVRCGGQNNKVLVCKPGETPVCTDFWNVTSYFTNGYRLGSCQGELLTSAKASSKASKIVHNLEVYPNPSKNGFKLMVCANENELGELIVRDQIGQIIERLRVKSNEYIFVGRDYRPGIYFAELTLGDKKYNAKLIKQ